MATPVTDPAILAQLNSSPEPKPVTDPEILKQLNADHTASEIAADIAKSGGIGVVKGGLGIAGMGGDVGSLIGAGVDKAGSMLGASPEAVQSFKDKAGTVLRYNPITSAPAQLMQGPTSHDLQSKLEDVTGPLYTPKTVAGEYAQTAGEFVPALVGGPETLASKALTRVAIPAALSETGGQLTKGTAAEPYARIAGALLSAGVPAAARRVVTPLPANPERAALVNALRNEGIDVSAGQATGNRPLQWMESTLGDLPGSGGRAAELQTRQGEQFTAAALRRAGEDANRATPEVIDRAFNRIGADFDALAGRNTLHMDPQFVTDLVDTAREYHAMVPPAMRSPVVENIVRDIGQTQAQNNGQIAGEAYQALRSRLDRAARNSPDPQLRAALRGIRGSLDDAMERSIQATNPADAGAWQQARNQYRNLMVLEKAATGAGSATAEGLISPSQLRNATVVAHGRRNYARGQGDFAELARAGEAVMKPLPNSGTAPRMYMQHLASALSGGAGASIAGLPGAIAGAAVPAAAGRGLMSDAVQAYLANQRLLPVAGNVRNRAIASALLARQGQSDKQ